MNPKFTSDAVFGIVSVAVLGVAGVVLNIVIARHYDTATLGAFNQVFAIYIFASQLATLGVQYGIVYYAAQTADNILALRTAAVVGLCIVAAFGAAVSACVGLLSGLIG